MSRTRAYDEEELFGHTRMSLGDHIEELRGVLWRAIKGFVVAMILGFVVARPVLGFLIAPLHHVLRDMEIDHLKKDQDESMEKAERQAAVVRVRKGDLASALQQARAADAEDAFTLTLTP